MIVLDTNVLSELMKAEPADNVREWTASQAASSLFITAVTQAEILYGVRLLADGRRRKSIAIAAKAMFDEDFNGRILAFDSDAATAYAEIAATRRSKGKPISQFDAQIASIARSTGAALATRTVSDFENCGIDLINPW
jgi:predicted nucleic acid-binding protein